VIALIVVMQCSIRERRRERREEGRGDSEQVLRSASTSHERVGFVLIHEPLFCSVLVWSGLFCSVLFCFFNSCFLALLLYLRSTSGSIDFGSFDFI
jgi:hypothetical protein